MKISFYFRILDYWYDKITPEEFLEKVIEWAKWYVEYRKERKRRFGY